MAKKKEPVEIRFHGEIEYEKEDGGAALIATIYENDMEEDENDTGMFVRVQSWDSALAHEQARQFEGRRVEIIVRTID